MAFTRVASAPSSSAPRSIPSHSVRGRRSSGNAPAPASSTSNPVTPAAAAPTASATSTTRSGAVAPTKRTVRWRVSTCTQRGTRPSGPRRTPSMSEAHAVTASGDNGTATNSRCSPSGTEPEPSGGRAAGAIPVLEQDPSRLGAVAPPDDVHVLVLEKLVGLEEVLDLDQAMGSDLVEALDVLLMRIADRDAHPLEVDPLLVAHLQPADRPCPHVAAGEGRLVDEQQDVRRIAVPGERVDGVAVVEVVEHGG